MSGRRRKGESEEAVKSGRGAGRWEKIVACLFMGLGPQDEIGCYVGRKLGPRRQCLG